MDDPDNSQPNEYVQALNQIVTQVNNMTQAIQGLSTRMTSMEQSIESMGDRIEELALVVIDSSRPLSPVDSE